MAEESHRKRQTTVRFSDPDLPSDARTAAVQAGYADLSHATAEHWAWLARRPGAKPPRRPDAAAPAARRLLGELQETVNALGLNDLGEARALVSQLELFAKAWWTANG